MSETAHTNATQDESQHSSTLGILIESFRLISRPLSKCSLQHLAKVFVVLEVRLLDLAPTEACTAIIPWTHLDLDESAHAICSRQTWLKKVLQLLQRRAR